MNPLPRKVKCYPFNGLDFSWWKVIECVTVTGLGGMGYTCWFLINLPPRWGWDAPVVG